MSLKLLSTAYNDSDEEEEEDRWESDNVELIGRNYFDCNVDSSDGEQAYDELQPSIKSDTIPVRSIPSAFHVLNGPGPSSSIFSDSTEEDVANTILEQHVKLTKAVDQKIIEKRTSTCRAFKKGRCSRGDRCRFSHKLAGGYRANMTANVANHPSHGNLISSPIVYDQWGREECPGKRRSRSGVTNTLMPSKKVMRMFGIQSKKERPWIDRDKELSQ